MKYLAASIILMAVLLGLAISLGLYLITMTHMDLSCHGSVAMNEDNITMGMSDLEQPPMPKKKPKMDIIYGKARSE